jgi:kumamolisin
MASAGRSAIAGSDREFIASHERTGPVDEQQPVTVTVYLRDPASGATADASAGTERLSHEQWVEIHGADPSDVEKVREFAGEHDLTVEDPGPDDRARRRMRLTGRLGALIEAFGVRDIATFRHPDGSSYRGRRGKLTVPSELAPIIVGVFGIDDRPQAKPHMRSAPAEAPAGRTPIEISEIYHFPQQADGKELDGEGETVAIIELEGGYETADLATYFDRLKVGMPKVSEVSVDGATNSPGVPADGEVMLDIEVVGALVPKATILVYFASNSGDQGFIDAVSQAVHDSQNKPGVVSISWGGPEDGWSEQGRNQMETVLGEAAELGVTVTVAAGDGGSTDGVTEEQENPLHQHVDFPASAPHALACGGTSLVSQGDAIVDEVVWNNGPGAGATGGGVSIEFPLPEYQQGEVSEDNYDTKQPGRGVPDVAGDADPNTGYLTRVHGKYEPVGGTSAVAPLWAALITRINQARGKSCGFLQPQLYALPAGVLNDITEGNNGVYEAHEGWDACTGLGTPNGEKLLAALSPAPAGNEQEP